MIIDVIAIMVAYYLAGFMLYPSMACLEYIQGKNPEEVRMILISLWPIIIPIQLFAILMKKIKNK